MAAVSQPCSLMISTPAMIYVLYRLLMCGGGIADMQLNDMNSTTTGSSLTALEPFLVQRRCGLPRRINGKRITVAQRFFERKTDAYPFTAYNGSCGKNGERDVEWGC